MIDRNKVRREAMRWEILVALNYSRPMGVYEEVLLTVIQALYTDSTALELRQALDYLEDRKLLELRKEPSGRWFTKLIRYGIDVVEYTVDIDPGIARPPKYWAE